MYYRIRLADGTDVFDMELGEALIFCEEMHAGCVIEETAEIPNRLLIYRTEEDSHIPESDLEQRIARSIGEITPDCSRN